MPQIIPGHNTPIRAYRAVADSVLAFQLTENNLDAASELLVENGTPCMQANGQLAFPPPWAALCGNRYEHAEPGDWIVTTDTESGFWAMDDAEFQGLWKVIEAEEPPPPPAEDLPPGVFARAELPGRREHTGWITEETRFGVQMAVVRDWDGLVVAEVAIGPGCQVVRLATPLRRPEPGRTRLALPSSRDPWEDDDPYGCGDDAPEYLR